MKAKQVIKRLRGNGWEVESTGSSHYKCVHTATGEILYLAGSASDARSMKNFMAHVKRVESGKAAEYREARFNPENRRGAGT